MNRSILAMFFEERYISIICHHKDNTNIRDILEKHHRSIHLAKNLISLGDLSVTPKNKVIDFHSAWGYSWEKVKPIEHTTPEDLIEYCNNVNASYLYTFKTEGWQETWLTPKPKPIPGTKKSIALYK